MANRSGNNIPQSYVYMPHHIFGHNSLNNLLLFYQPKTIEEQLSLIEVYILVNDFSSAEALIEQVYDDIKHIEQFVQDKEQLMDSTTADNNPNDAIGQKNTGQGNTIDEQDDGKESHDTPQQTAKPAPRNLPQHVNKVPLQNLTKEDLVRVVYPIRQMLKNNSILIRTLKNAAYNASSEAFPVVKPDGCWVTKADKKKGGH